MLSRRRRGILSSVGTATSRLAVLLVVTTALAGCTSSGDQGGAAGGSDADVTVVTGGDVYTLDPSQPWAEAFAYDRDGVIVAVGTEDEVLQAAGDDPRVIDVGGNMVLPGFQDPHVHVPEAGINEEQCLLPPGESLETYEALVADCAAERPDDTWVRAAGASLFDLRETDELPIDVLDRAVPDRPALILDDLGHAAWTNSAGLEAAGIAEDDADPQGGILLRDPATGRLTGLLLENAQQPVRNAAALDDDANYEGLLVALEELARNGITAVSDAGGYWGQGHPAAWQRALDEGTLTVRAANALYVYPDLPVEAQLDELAGRFSDDPDSLLRFDTAKIYIDGILDLGTAAVVEPYLVPPDPAFPSGFEYFTADQLQTYVTELHRIGYRIHFHVIGDAATRIALDAVAAIPADDVADRRHRTTHTYLVHPDDVARFAELGVIADFQVGPDAIDPAYHRDLAGLIGPTAFDLIPVATMLEAGASVTLSSDWDADPLPPLGTIERALTRESNAVADLAEAISLVTLDAAFALGHEDTTGSIEVGKFADYVVVDRNLFDVDPADIDEIQVLLTALAGEETYRAADFAG